MLDADTKRRIDTARDILVGKVPDPKSQVEQITIALIYKFMDDMDAEAEEFGGKRKFFAGEFERYGWAKLMRSGLGGHEMLGLYGEAIAKMPENPGIPLLFRDIFKNAYLPYRDPETLRAFLKIIDEFSYDHSEKLGDAYEYLLSVLGSQGNAGQFRTPRHIIDFIVDVIDPKKTDTLLDPACGSAGFLISSYKHILKANADKKGHSTLTPDEKGRLAKNITGYDIDPLMVRLSLVNLYLHGFADPHIHEYDSLSRQERWNETADVILANPPFMSPKGGITPHNRFTVKSKRSEVLFVDYMAEHLRPNGRAGIIVPEGVIFQSQTAYKQLRKNLVEDYLVAVVSLPAGVFQPYSGVKTSILIFDKALAKKSDSIAFYKIEQDGFGLGAQRRETGKSDLPAAAEFLKQWLTQNFQSLEKFKEANPSALIVAKDKIAENGDYNLSGERYRESIARASHFPTAPLGEICDLIGGGTPSKKNESYWSNGSVKWISSKHIDERGQIKGHELISTEAVKESSTKIAPKGSTIIITRVSVGKFAFADDDYAINQDLTALVSKDAKRLDPEFIRVVALHIATVVDRNAEGIGVRGVTRKFLSELQIPLPPLEIQKEIVAEIEGYQNVIDGARAVLNHYRPHIPIHPDWPIVELGEITKPEYGFTEKAAETGDARFIRITDIAPDGTLRTEGEKFITLNKEARGSMLAKGDILVARTGATFGKTMIFEEDYPAVFASFLIRLRFPKDRVLPRYYWVFAQSDLYWNQAKALMTGGAQPQFNGNALVQVKIPLPPLAEQQAIVAEIEAEQALVNANRELIERMEAKIQSVLSRIWGEGDKP
jgi:type I restriction enzyme M protein